MADVQRGYFHVNEAKIFDRLVMFKELVAEHPLCDGPCPLMATQLNELNVICKILLEDINALTICVNTANGGD